MIVEGIEFTCDACRRRSMVEQSADYGLRTFPNLQHPDGWYAVVGVADDPASMRPVWHACGERCLRALGQLLGGALGTLREGGGPRG